MPKIRCVSRIFFEISTTSTDFSFVGLCKNFTKRARICQFYSTEMTPLKFALRINQGYLGWGESRAQFWRWKSTASEVEYFGRLAEGSGTFRRHATGASVLAPAVSSKWSAVLTGSAPAVSNSFTRSRIEVHILLSFQRIGSQRCSSGLVFKHPNLLARIMSSQPTLKSCGVGF